MPKVHPPLAEICLWHDDSSRRHDFREADGIIKVIDMEITHRVPFFSNTADETHCFQAVLRMVLKHFIPKKEYTWAELETVTAKVKNLWTWPMAGLIWLSRNGFDVKYISSFDFKQFELMGKGYLKQEYGDAIAHEQDIHSDIPTGQKLIPEFLSCVATDNKIPSRQDIQELLKAGYLIGCNVNLRMLNHQSGYVGHFVLITGCADSTVILHDPGLPPVENRVESWQNFECAWAFPNNKAKDIMAFKLR